MRDSSQWRLSAVESPIAGWFHGNSDNKIWIIWGNPHFREPHPRYLGHKVLQDDAMVRYNNTNADLIGYVSIYIYIHMPI